MKARLVALLLALVCAAGAAAAHFRQAAAPATPVAAVTDDPGTISDEVWGWYDAEEVLPDDVTDDVS
jgi:hypothetical protein